MYSSESFTLEGMIPLSSGELKDPGAPKLKKKKKTIKNNHSP